MTYKRVTELLDLVTTLWLLISVYYFGMETEDESIKNQYRIVLVILFIATFSPFWISYSALLKIMWMDGRYEKRRMAERGCFTYSILGFNLTFMAPTLFMLAKIIQAVGECITTPFLLTCN